MTEIPETLEDVDDPDLPGLREDQKRVFLMICQRMSEGELVTRMLPAYNMSRGKLYRWIESSDQSRELYARARVLQAHAIAEEAINISDGTDELGKLYDDLAELHADTIDPNHRGTWLAAFRNGRVQRDKIRVDGRKWLASKINPRNYGDKLDITTGGDAIKPGVVMLPVQDAPLIPPEDGAVIEQTTRVAVSGVARQTSAVMSKLLADFREGKLVTAEAQVGTGDDEFYGDVPNDPVAQ